MRYIKSIMSQMTLEEKVGLCSGADFWRLKSVEHLGIPTVMVSDGPYGLRKQEDKADHLAINESIKAVCFPTGSSIACSFDTELLYELGEALGEECQAENISILLGPAVNIKRSPLCGRNFEYFSEDPYLTTQLATTYIQGVQSQNVGTSLKHFACNNQESRRMTASAEVDERTLREIYLAAFEGAVKQGKPWTVMTSYNRLNGTYTSESEQLLTRILRDEWGFEGYVMSDWGAVNNRVAGLKAGMDLEMPGSNGTNDQLILNAIHEGTLSEDILNESVERILRKIFQYVDHRKQVYFDKEKHHQLARRIEAESAVLLKNNGVLPLCSTDSKIAFIGEFAKMPRFQGGGSSHINAYKISSALDTTKDMPNVHFAQGYHTAEDKVDETLLNEAVELAKSCETVVLFVGLPDAFESEGYDRTHMGLPNCQNELIKQVTAVQENTIVVLHNGAPVEMPWVHDVAAILEMYLGGQAVGDATVDLLFGHVNPSGKLAESFPIRLEDNPSYLSYKVVDDKIYYDEKLFVGYRYYDTKQVPVLFPFGHGCSYTTFEYENLLLSKHQMRDTEALEVTVSVTNTGDVFGKEVVQLYISDLTETAIRPKKELKGFKKIALQVGETKTVSFTLDKRSFAYYHPEISDWYVPSGKYEILIGKSSETIVLKDCVIIESTTKLPFKVTPNTTFEELVAQPKLKPIMLGLLDIMWQVDDNEAITKEMQLASINDMPLRALRSFQGVSNEMINSLVITLNQLIK